jgi:lipid A 3-O-deacylase
MLAIAASALPASAGTISQNIISELRLGFLDHDPPGLWSAFQVEKHTFDYNAEAMFQPLVQFGGGVFLPAVGGTLNGRGGTSHAYADLRWLRETDCGLYAMIGIGAAVHNGKLDHSDRYSKALGSRELFHIPIEFGYRLDQHNSVAAYFEHTSNANTANYNDGLDRIGVRYGYKF